MDNPLKTCKKCNQPKAEVEFGKCKNSRDRLQYWCKECRRQCQRADSDRINKHHRDRYNSDSAVRLKAKEYGCKYNRQHKYNITQEQYDQMLQVQHGVCACCHQPETVTQNGELRRLCVDHCHITGKVRSLLCHKCNAGLGQFNDDIQQLSDAIEYLKLWHSNQRGA